jgi:hypothetical protein
LEEVVIVSQLFRNKEVRTTPSGGDFSTGYIITGSHWNRWDGTQMSGESAKLPTSAFADLVVPCVKEYD